MTRTMISEKPVYFVCTAENPWPKGGPVPVIHPAAIEGEQHDGWPAGDYVDMRCPYCGHTWEKELPQ